MTTTATTDLARRLAETVNAVRARTSVEPRIGVVLGTNLGGFAEKLRSATRIPYRELPHLPATSGSLHVGLLDDVPVACLDGRPHLYDGHEPWRVVHGVRVVARLGVKSALVTNAAGSLHAEWELGTMMAVVDHLDLMAHGPLGDLGDLTTPFPNMANAYDVSLREELHAAARAETLLSARIRQHATAIELEEGVYAALRDPTCETPAHVRMLQALGAGTVGSSTVPEVVALRQLGVRVAALSYVTHYAAGVTSTALEDESTSRLSLTTFERVVRAWVIRADRA